MKHLFSKVAVAVIALFSICAPVITQAAPANRGAHIHYLSDIKGRDLIRLEDGSEWRAATEKEAFIAQGWQRTYINHLGQTEKLGDRLVISQNNGFFSSSNFYPFYITNQEDGTYVRVEPVASPVHYGPNSFWLFNANRELGNIYLVSGKGGEIITWEVSSSYQYQLNDWEPNDHIVVGTYDSVCSFLNSYNYILINFDKASYVQAKPH